MECVNGHEDDEDYELQGIEFYFVAVMDGYYKASPSMIRYVDELFGKDVDILCGYGMNPDGTLGRVEIAPGKFLNLTLIVKKQNRKKTNSHEWFFRAFVPHFNGHFAYTTDCGTLYAPNCLHDMILFLVRNADTAAVTGRQRVMSADMQSLHSESMQAMWYRAAQAYDYEASISAFQGAFSLCGMLPVLPGPCGMYRVKDIEGAALNYYMHFINNTSPDDGLLAGNLMLAEDRILSYAASLKTGQYTRWVPSAIFYFEAETESMKFIAQRRRWTNGTFCCYLYLLFLHPGLVFSAPRHSFFFKISIYIQLLIQAILYCVTSVSPAIFVSLVYFSVLNLNIGSGETSNYIAYAVLLTYGVLYFVYSVGHYFVKFIESLFTVVLVWNTVMFAFILGITITTFINQNYVAVALIGVTVGFPFLLALCHSFDVFMMMMFNFIPFFLFLPTFIPWFMAYSLSRTWDLSWGNRPAKAAEGKGIDTKRKLKIYGAIILFLAMTANYALAGIFFWINSLDIMVLVSVSIASIGLSQQLLSFVFYLGYTDHTMSSVFNNRKKITLKIFSLTLAICCLALLYASMFTTAWLTTNIEIFRYYDNTTNTSVAVDTTIPSQNSTGEIKSDGYVQLGYGLLFISTKWHTNFQYPNDDMQIWGSNILFNVPNQTWSFALILMLVATFTFTLAFVSIIYSYVVTDKSRIFGVSVLYSAIAIGSMLFGILLFPFSFSSLKTYHVGWWYNNDQEE
eukprot:Pgem_evm2s9467